MNKLIIVIAFLVTACGQNKDNQPIEQTPNKDLFLSIQDFESFKSTQVNTIQTEIDAIKQDIAALKNNIADTRLEIETQAEKFNKVTEYHKYWDETNKNAQEKINELETVVKTLKTDIGSIKSHRTNTKAKIIKPIFPYKIMGISQWGDAQRISFKINNDYIFAAKGDVIQQWRIDNIDFDKLTVGLVHQKGTRVTRMVQ